MPKHAAMRDGRKPLTAHDRNLQINKAPSPKWVASFRDLIRSKALINRLQTFVFDDPDNLTSIRMTRTQAMVALSLLRKVLPDMQAIEISGNSEKPLVVQVLRFSDGMVIDADHSGIPAAPAALDVADVSAPGSAEIRITSILADGDSSIPYSGPSSDTLPPSIEHNARLIEDEPPQKPASPRRTSRRQ
jgi:hypothetical protein